MTDIIKSKIDGLRGNYLQRLDGMVEELYALIDGRESGHDQSAILGGIKAIAHKLSGTAPTFGFERLGESARALDEAIAEGAREMTQELRVLITVFLQDANEALEEHGL